VPAAADFPSSRRVVVPARAGLRERTFELEVALVDPDLLKLRSPRHADLPCYVLTFDDVTEQVVRAQEEARRARLAAVGEIAAKLGHEIRNSLGGLRLFLDNIRDEIAPASRAARAYHSMVREIEFLQRKIDELREFGQDPRLDLEPADLKEVLDEALAFASSKLSDKHIRVVLECDRSLRPLLVDRRRLREAFQNLIHNAIEAAPEGGRVSIAVEQGEGGNGAAPAGVHVHIEDNGPGIPPETREHVFSLFFTTKPNIGTGLGLPIAKKIVESHGGQISFTCGPRGGTRFTVSLPAAQEVEGTR
jgi:signal transduction histidine kinase